MVYSRYKAMGNKKEKILIATPLYPPDVGGPATYAKILEQELPKRGVEVKLVKFSDVKKWPRILRHFLYFLKVLKSGGDIKIIFALDPVSVGLPAILAAKLLGKKFIVKVVGDFAWEQYVRAYGFVDLEKFQEEQYDLVTELRRKIERWVARCADKVIVPSEYLRKIVLLWGVEPSKVKVIYNAVDSVSRS